MSGRGEDDLVQLDARVTRGLRRRVAVEAARRGSTKGALVAAALGEHLDAGFHGEAPTLDGALARLAEARGRAAQARACVGQNRGPDRELAREGYEQCVADELLPALLAVLGEASGEVPARSIEAMAARVERFLERRGVR